jgi:hypothetical protein
LFDLVHQVNGFMVDFPRPWFICGGWAIDLFLETETRQHSDIEIGIFRSDQAVMAAYLKGWFLDKIVPGNPSRKEPWGKGEYLQIPIHEVYAVKGELRLEILLNEGEGTDWLFRRDQRVKASASSLVGTYDGIPYLNPQVALLYKARNPRDKDQADLRNVLPKMTKEAKTWLQQSIRNSEGANHLWIGEIEKSGSK